MGRRASLSWRRNTPAACRGHRKRLPHWSRAGTRRWAKRWLKSSLILLRLRPDAPPPSDTASPAARSHRTLSLPLLEAGLLDEVLLPEQMAGLAQARPALHLLRGGDHVLPLLWGQTRAAPGLGGRAKDLAHAQLGGSAGVPRADLAAAALLVAAHIVNPLTASARSPGSGIVHRVCL